MGLFDSKKLGATLAKADEARDTGNWATARALYQQYIDISPNDASILVQLGHARKETGDLGGAELAYGQSITIEPSVADTHVQLGHVFKLTGRTEEAISAYNRAVEIDPKLESAWRELRAFGFERFNDQEGPQRTSQRVIDLSDVFFYLRHHSTVSGIQRVQLGIAKSIIDSATSGDDYIFVTATADHSGYIAVSYELINKLVRVLAKTEVSLSELRAVGDRAQNEGEKYLPVAGDLVLILGAFWVLPNVIEQLIALKRKGVRVGVMIHDIIPITHPEYCEIDLTDTFNMYINSVLAVVDLIISISKHTQSEVAKLLEARNIRKPAMLVLSNAHTTWSKKTAIVTKLSPAIEETIAFPYILYVSTIEVRKNHTLLFKVWKNLIAKHGGSNVPNLVFVGRPGWRVRDLMDQIIGTNYLNGKIKILHDISDVELQVLYENCLSTTFPSFEEGWGLPVGEGLIFGKSCIASRASSVPEVGEDFVEYIDPNNVDESFSVFERFIFDESYRRSRTQNIVRNFRPRTWGDVVAQLRHNISELFPVAAGGHTAPLLETSDTAFLHLANVPPGKLHCVGHKDARSHYINRGFGPLVHFVFGAGWYPVENFGRWLARGKGSMEFCVCGGAPDDVVIYINISAVGWFSGNNVAVSVNGERYVIQGIEPGKNKYYKLTGKVVAGVLRLDFKVLGFIQSGSDPRTDLSIGVCSFGYAMGSDVNGRMSLLEGMYEIVQVDPVTSS